MEITKTLRVSDPAKWRHWLEKHYQTEKEIWLVYPKKSSGKSRISYNDAVEQALCFGWIDSTAKPLDEDHTAQRFTPRKPGSPISQANQERLRLLVEQGQVLPEVEAGLGNLLKKKFKFPADILAAIKADKEAWKNYRKFSPAYKRIRVAFIEGARDRPAEFEKRLRYFIRMSAQNKMFGFGGIEKYY